MTKTEEMNKKIEELDRKLKLINLAVDKKYADLGLKMGELEGRIKKISDDFPSLKEKTNEVGDLLSVINLGLIKSKKDFDDFKSKISKLENVPENFQKTMTNYEKKLKSLDEETTKLSAGLKTLENMKGDVGKIFEEVMSTNVKSLREEDEKNKIELGHLRKDIETISTALKSFERTIELTNLDDIIRRFDSLDKKMGNTQTEVETLRNMMPSVSLTTGDVEVLKKRVKEMSSSIMNALNRMNEFEVNVNKKILSIDNLVQKAQHLEYIESMSKEVKKNVANLNNIRSEVELIFSQMKNDIPTLNFMKNDIETIKNSFDELGRVVNDIKLNSLNKEEVMEIVTVSDKKVAESVRRVGELNKKMERIENRWDSFSTRIDKLDTGLKELSTDNRNIRLLQKDVERLWNTNVNIHKSLKTMKSKTDTFERKSIEILQGWEDELRETRERMDKIDENLQSFLQMPENMNKIFTDVTNRIKELEDQTNKIMCDYVNKKKGLESEVTPEKLKELDVLKDQVEGMRKSMMTFNKLWEDYKASINEKLSMRRPGTTIPVITGEVPANITDEISSLKNMLNKLSAENEQMRKLTRDARVDHMQSITPDVFTNLSARVTSIEKKIGEVEKDLSKTLKSKPVILE